MRFVASANLKPARALALDDDPAVPRAQFDLSDVTDRAVNLLADSGARSFVKKKANPKAFTRSAR